MPQKLLLIALAGGLGTLARFGVTSWVHSLAGVSIFWGTLAANAIGCLLFGLVIELAKEGGILSAEMETILLVGFLGAMTTFSTYIFETQHFLKTSQWWLAIGGVVLQNVLGLTCIYFGVWLGRLQA